MKKGNKKAESEQHLKELETLLEKDIRDSEYSSSSKFYLFRMGIRFAIYLVLTLFVYLVGLVKEFKVVMGAIVFFVVIELVRLQFSRRSKGN